MKFPIYGSLTKRLLKYTLKAVIFFNNEEHFNNGQRLNLTGRKYDVQYRLSTASWQLCGEEA